MSSRLFVALLTGCALAVSVTACSTSASNTAARSSSTTRVSGAADSRTAAVTITAAQGCQTDKQTVAAGGITVKIANKDATAVSEVELLSGDRIVGEKENIPPGFSGEFAAVVPAGTYTLYCPGAPKERTSIRATGSVRGTGDSSTATLLATATTGYARYVDTQVAALLAAAEVFDTALHGKDLGAAQRAYMRARPYYEKVEPVAESFVIGKDSIDADIDVRAGDVPATRWRGFHRIEKALFQQKSLTGMAAYGDQLVADIERLHGLTKGLKYEPTELANGAQELLDEVASTKITGEEERYSHIDLLDFANNDEGAEQAFAQLQPALDKIDTTLSAAIQAGFAALDKLVGTYRTGANPSGFKLYTELTATDKRSLATAVKAVQEPLSQVASKVAIA